VYACAIDSPSSRLPAARFFELAVNSVFVEAARLAGLVENFREV
jgi:hypothetical protein